MPQWDAKRPFVMREGMRHLDIRRRQQLVLVLAVVSGATDAVGYLHLGGAFSSVMTGNMVLLGVGAGTANGARAAHAGVAILAFIGGCVIGTRAAGRPQDDDPIWPHPVTRALAVEWLIFASYAVGLEACGGDPQHSYAKTALLALNAVALGVQSSAVQRFGVSGLSTTYLTGTLTQAMIHISSGGQLRLAAHQFQLLAALIAGAAAGALLATHAMRLTPALQLGGVCLVLAYVIWSRNGGPRAGLTPDGVALHPARVGGGPQHPF